MAEKSRNSSIHEGFCCCCPAVAAVAAAVAAIEGSFWEEKSGQCGVVVVVMVGIFGGSCAINGDLINGTPKKKKKLFYLWDFKKGRKKEKNP